MIRGQRTDQLLFTSPTSLTGIVLGKYFAAVSVFVLTLLITCIYPIILSLFGNLATWEIVGGYIGFLLLGSAFYLHRAVYIHIDGEPGNSGGNHLQCPAVYVDTRLGNPGTSYGQNIRHYFRRNIALALGAFVYFNTRNIYVGVATTLVGAIIIVLTYFLADKYFFDGFIVRVFEWFSLLKRYEEFQIGILSLSPIVYYITFSAAFVFLTIRVLEKRRWS